MANVAGGGQVWPFFYSRNKAVDYAFLLLPEPLAANPPAKLALMQFLRPEQAGAVQHHELKVGERSLDVHHVYREASLDGQDILDGSGRQVGAIWGVLSDGPMEADTARAAIEQFERANRGLAQLFWLGKAREPVISSGGSIELRQPTGSKQQPEPPRQQGTTSQARPKGPLLGMVLVGIVALLAGIVLGADGPLLIKTVGSTGFSASEGPTEAISPTGVPSRDCSIGRDSAHRQCSDDRDG